MLKETLSSENRHLAGYTPIRVSKLSNGMYALNLHEWHICKDAFNKG